MLGPRHLAAIGVAASLAVGLPCAAEPAASGGEPPGVSGGQPAVSANGISYVPDDQLAPKELVDAIRARRGGKLLNLDRMLLHSPSFAKGWNALLGAIRSDLSVPPRLGELAIMATGALNGCEYVWGQHEPAYLKAGGTKAQLARLRDVPAALRDTTLFDEPERATLALALEMTRDVAVTPATLKRIRAVLPDKQVVELIGAVSGYNMVTRFVVATGVQMD